MYVGHVNLSENHIWWMDLEIGVEFLRLATLGFTVRLRWLKAALALVPCLKLAMHSFFIFCHLR